MGTGQRDGFSEPREFCSQRKRGVRRSRERAVAELSAQSATDSQSPTPQQLRTAQPSWPGLEPAGMGFVVEETWKELRREVRRRERDQEGLQQVNVESHIHRMDTTKREKMNCEKAQQSLNSGKEERRGMENFPQHMKEEKKGEMERQSFPLVGSKIEKEETTVDAVRQMSEVVKEKQEEMIGLKREEEEEIVE
jgi:hypothetical protein